MMYNAMADAVVLSALMSQNNYYYDTNPVAQNRPVVVRRGPSGLVIFLVIIGGLVTIVAIGVMINKMNPVQRL
jgi:hypothetical protein